MNKVGVAFLDQRKRLLKDSSHFLMVMCWGGQEESQAMMQEWQKGHWHRWLKQDCSTAYDGLSLHTQPALSVSTIALASSGRTLLQELLFVLIQPCLKASGILQQWHGWVGGDRFFFYSHTGHRRASTTIATLSAEDKCCSGRWRAQKHHHWSRDNILSVGARLQNNGAERNAFREVRFKYMTL